MNKPIALLICLSVALSVSACRRTKAPLTPAPPDWMMPELTKAAHAIAPGAPEHRPVLHAIAYREDDFTRWPIRLDAGSCYIFSGVGDDSVREIYMELLNPEEDRVVRYDEDTDRGVMEHCPQVTGTFELMAKVTEGHGHYLVGVYNKSGAAAPAAADKPDEPDKDPVAAVLSALTKLVDELAQTAAPKANRVGDPFPGDADSTDWYVALMDNQCYWFVGVAGDGVKDLELGVWDPEDNRVASDKSKENRITVEYCPKASGMHRFQAKVVAGSGKYEFGVFAKKK